MTNNRGGGRGGQGGKTVRPVWMETHFNPTKSKVISIGRMNSNQSNEMSVVFFFSLKSVTSRVLGYMM